MKNNQDMKGIYSALLISFDENGKINEQGVREIIRHNIDKMKVDGLYVGGSTGENFMLSTEEKKEIFKNPRTVSAAILTGCKNITEMVTEGQYIYCKDWNIRKRIVCSEKVIGKALGIRAHDIKVIKEREYADAKCVVEDVIESTFDMIYLLRPDGAKKPLRMQLPKSQVLVYHEKEEVYISLWEEALLFLQQ